jgi:glycerate 2-kinase
MRDVQLAREAIRRWYDTAVQAVEPRRAVSQVLCRQGDDLWVGEQRTPLGPGRVVVLSIGKAAEGMARGAMDALDGRIDAGILLTKYGHLTSTVEGFEAYEAGHPVPDNASLLATRRVLNAVSGLTPDDLVLALISGGGSALLELPIDGVSLDDMRTTTRVLMHAGAGIHDLNATRTALSEVKGGGLRRAIGPARCVTVLLSDVLGNDPSVIASGPTVAPPGDTASPLDIIDRFGVHHGLPPAVIAALHQGARCAGDTDTSRDIVAIAADNATLLRAAASAAIADGLTVTCDWEPYDGTARDLGTIFVQVAREAPDDTDVILRGGEATVEVKGDGVGGRNTETALAAALALQHDTHWVVASLASDGDDGNSGAAGAVADGETVSRAMATGIDPVAALERNDSASLFRAVGGLVETGPTGTNVNDVYIAVRRRVFERQKDTG